MSDESKKEVSTTTTADLAFPELTQSQISGALNQLVEIMPEHGNMLTTIKESLPEIHRASSLFYKHQSQFMDNMMTVSHMTPLRNLRQILAQITATRSALRESHHKLIAKEIELEEKELEIQYLEKKIKLDHRDPAVYSLELEYEVKKMQNRIRKLNAECDDIRSNAEIGRGYISGAIRQLTSYTEQYNQIKATYKIGEFTEADFEAEEERYHIMKAFEQGLCAARTRFDGSIDEGNMIYMTQIGINGAHAQRRVTDYLNEEKELFANNKAPTHAMYRNFLEMVAKEFAGSAKDFAAAKGMNELSQTALIDKGDTRLSGKKSEE